VNTTSRPVARAFGAAAVLATALAPTLALAQTATPERCRAYADTMVEFGRSADAKACPTVKRHEANWDAHFQWCTGRRAAQVQDAEDRWGATLDGCMSGIEAARTERALADADRQARANAVIGTYDERWAKGLRRMSDQGMNRPFDRKGFEFPIQSTEPKRWAAGLIKDQQLGFYAVCDTCQGMTMRILDAAGKVVEQARTTGNAVDLIAYPTTGGKGTIEFTVTNCRTKDDSCKVRYTSFTL
jgi:hypothetical protein